MVNTPNTYSEWVLVLDKLKNKEDDEAVLMAMKQGTIQWQSGVAERFALSLTSAVDHRLNKATDKFQKEMGYSKGSERMIVGALNTLKKELTFLADAIDLPVIPEKDRARYVKLVKDQADNIQKSLEDSAKSDRTGKLSSIVRNNKVNGF